MSTAAPSRPSRHQNLYAHHLWMQQRFFAGLLLLAGVVATGIAIYQRQLFSPAFAVWLVYIPTGLLLGGAILLYRWRSNLKVLDEGVQISSMLTSVTIDYDSIKSVRALPLRQHFQDRRSRMIAPIMKQHIDKPAVFIRVRGDDTQLAAIKRRLGLFKARLMFEDTIAIPVQPRLCGRQRPALAAQWAGLRRGLLSGRRPQGRQGNRAVPPDHQGLPVLVLRPRAAACEGADRRRGVGLRMVPSYIPGRPRRVHRSRLQHFWMADRGMPLRNAVHPDDVSAREALMAEPDLRHRGGDSGVLRRHVLHPVAHRHDRHLSDLFHPRLVLLAPGPYPEPLVQRVDAVSARTRHRARHRHRREMDRPRRVGQHRLPSRFAYRAAKPQGRVWTVGLALPLVAQR